MKRIVLVLMSIVFVFSFQNSFGRGQAGHRVVAKICFDHLNDKTKDEINEILGDNYLTQIATWPDFIRSEKNWDFTKKWHYAIIYNG